MRTIFYILLCCLMQTVAAQNEPVTVFRAGEGGYAVFRIPAIIRIPSGELLAFAEGRVHTGADFGDIDIVMKRSIDAGKTWSSLQKITDYDSLQSGNPAPVVDMLDPRFPGGRIFLFYNTGTVSEADIRHGKGYKQVWYITSVDGGASWSAPTDITIQVSRPLKPSYNAAWNFPEDWRCYANTPGHAVQFTEGEYKGRIFIAANHSEGDAKSGAEDYYTHGFYSDNHGAAFQLSENVPLAGSNEATAAVLPDGQLLMNIRNQKGDQRYRIIARSNNGGGNWSEVYFDTALPDPVCEGSMLLLNPGRRKSLLAFSNNASHQRRDSLTVYLSSDLGRSWPRKYLIDAGAPGQRGDCTAYSDLVAIPGKQLGILYEKNDYRLIVFRRLSL
jgi:sialidase-1